MNENSIFSDFGYCRLVRVHSIEVHIEKEEILFVENPHSRRETTTPIVKARLSAKAWKQIARPVARELNRRIKQNEDLRHCRASKWKSGRNEVDLHLGREMLVLVWAVEHLGDDKEAILTALAYWSELPDVDRLYFYRQVNAQTGRAEDMNTPRRRGLSTFFLGTLPR